MVVRPLFPSPPRCARSFRWIFVYFRLAAVRECARRRYISSPVERGENKAYVAASRVQDGPEPYPVLPGGPGFDKECPRPRSGCGGARSSPGSTRPVIMRRPRAPFNGDGSYCDAARGQLLRNRPWIEQVQKRMPVSKLWISTTVQTTRPDGLAVGRG